MRFINILLAITLIPSFSISSELPQPNAQVGDTFGDLLAMQVQLMESEIEAKIRANKNLGLANSSLGSMPSNATPLLEARQDYSHVEPVLEAIWGIVGHEVAELNYKGRHLPVSMQKPYISKIDGWKLESITPYSITMLKMDGKRIQIRKSITLDWHKSASDSIGDKVSPVQVN